MNSDETLQAIELFSGFDDDEISAFVNATARRSLPPDHIFFSMGSVNSSLFIICTGAVKVERIGTAEDIPLAILEAGKTFGEMSFMDGSRTTAVVTTTEPTEVLEISRESVDQLLDDNPGMGVKLWRNLALDLKQRLSQTNELIDHYIDVSQVLTDNRAFGKVLGRI